MATFVPYSRSLSAPSITVTSPQSPHSDNTITSSCSQGNEQFKAAANTTHENDTPSVGHCCDSVVDVRQIVHHPAQYITIRQPVQQRRLQPRNISRHHRSRKDSHVLKPILLGPFGADDGVPGGFVERLVLVQTSGQRVWLGVVEFPCGFGIVDGDGVDVWDDG